MSVVYNHFLLPMFLKGNDRKSIPESSADEPSPSAAFYSPLSASAFAFLKPCRATTRAQSNTYILHL